MPLCLFLVGLKKGVFRLKLSSKVSSSGFSVRSRLLCLQGPPGTGKTETLQLAVLAHVAAHRANGRCRVLMVAPTHKAIQEFVSKLARCWQEYCQAGGNDLKDLKIYRVLSSSTSSC